MKNAFKYITNIFRIFHFDTYLVNHDQEDNYLAKDLDQGKAKLFIKVSILILIYKLTF